MRSKHLWTLVALASCSPSPGRVRTPEPSPQQPRMTAVAPIPVHEARALVFRAEGFPTLDAPPIEDRTLDQATNGLPVTKTADLAEKLTRRDYDVLVLPYGSAFPVDAWPKMRAFLHEGGGLVVLGGAPFHEPVRREGGAWIRGPRATTFAHDLLIGPAESIALPGARAVSLVDPVFASIAPQKTYALTVRLATQKDFPDEHGSDGPRDAVLRPLVHVVDASNTPRGAALVEIDHRLGPKKGARWVLETSDAKLEAPAIRAMIGRALEGASELTAMPTRASLALGQDAGIFVHADRYATRKDEPLADRVSATVRDAAGHEIYRAEGHLGGPRDARTATLIVPSAKLSPGFYRVAVDAPDAPFTPRTTNTGFWVHDEKLLRSAPPMDVSRDWLRRDGKPFPVVGTTYMASDVHRRFLFEPNPYLWDRDFAEMKRRGIGFVRTGIWTAWSRVLGETGGVDSGVRAAIDAYVLTAARNGIVVCFNFFAFLPPAWGGTNPYLDPKSLDQQAALLTTVSSGFSYSDWVHWDLINEPSYAPRPKLWSTRAIGDDYEKKAWRAWVEKRHGNDMAKLRALWRDPGDDVLAVPTDDDWEQHAVQVDRHPRKTRDFREFVEEVLYEWAARMRRSLTNGLVTLGQDEGGIYERPTQQLLANALHYSSVHTWWKNDDLLWDGVVTKVPEKPILHQETGLMRLEDLDGTPWRSPDAAAALLERKLGYAFAARGAGVVEWAWNVNPTMPIDEESTIGLFRPDGTAKPELDALQRIAAFFTKAAPLLDDFAPDPVVMIVPHARAFLGKSGAIDATKIVVRVLAERFGVVPTAISDLKLTSDRLRDAKLILVPCAEVLDEPAAKALLDASKSGKKVLFTGPIEGDSYGRETPSLRALGVLGDSRPLAMNEKSEWSSTGSVAFEGLLQETARRAPRPSVAKLEGAVWHEPLPIELGREREPLVKLLGAALAAAGVPTMPGESGVAARVLVAPKSALVVVVNERPEPAIRRVIVDGRALSVPVRALGARLALIDRTSHAIVVSTEGDAIAAMK